ncbi:MAG: hypothetical protein ACLUTU_17115 [Blautia faecis]
MSRWNICNLSPGNSLPNKLEEGLIVTPLKTDKVWKWIYLNDIKKSLKLEILYLKRLPTSGLVDQNGNKSTWNIYNKLWLSEQQQKE